MEKQINTDPPLVDAVVMSILNESFKVPDALTIAASYSAGEKTFFKVCAMGERFWCEVEHVLMGGAFIGRVDNELTCTDRHNLKHNELIKIEYYHIYEIR